MLFNEIWGADSGDIVSAIYTRGSIHPPGYPLYFLLGQLFKYLPWGTEAQKMAVISLIFSALAVYATKRIIDLFLVGFSNSEERVSRLKAIGLLSLLFLVGGYLWMIYSLVPEVFTASAFFVCLNIYYLLKFLEDGSDRSHLRFYLTLFTGLFFQYTIALNGIIYLYFMRKDLRNIAIFIKKHIRKLLLMLILAISPYLIFYLIWDRNAVIFWQQKNLISLIRLATRAEYGIISTSVNSYQSLVGKLQNLWFYFETLVRHFTPFGIMLAAIGYFHLKKRSLKLTSVIFWFWFLYGPFLFFYLDANMENNISKAIMERFAVLSLPIFTVFIAGGFWYMAAGMKAVLGKYISNKALLNITHAGICCLFVVMLPLLLLVKNARFIASLAKNRLFYYHARNLFEGLPNRSLLILAEDTYLFPSQYYRYVRKYRPDIRLISHTRMYKSGYMDVLRKYYPDLKYPKGKQKNNYLRFIRLNLKSGVPIYSNLAFKSKEFKLTRHGLLYKVTGKKDKLKTALKPNLAIEFLTDMNYPYPIYFLEVLRDVYANSYYHLALAAKKQEKGDKVRELLNIGYRIKDDNHDLNVLLGLVLLKSKKCARANDILVRDFDRKPTSETALILSKAAAVCSGDLNAYEYWDKQAKKLR